MSKRTYHPDRGDLIEMNFQPAAGREIDTRRLVGRLDLVGEAETPSAELSTELGNQILKRRPSRADLAARADLPDDTRLWAALQAVGGGTWGGCVYDVDRIVELLGRGTD